MVRLTVRAFLLYKQLLKNPSDVRAILDYAKSNLPLIIKYGNLKLNILQEYIKEHHVRRNTDETRVIMVDDDDITEENERTSWLA